MSETGPAANRTGAASGVSSSGRPRRTDRWAGRFVGRALEIGRAHGVYAVEINGVRFILKCEEKAGLEPKGKKAAHARASRPRVEPASAPAVRGPNHAKRKSAERMRKHLEQKGVACAGSGKAEEPSAELTPTAAEPAPVEPDARMIDAAPVSDANTQRGQKRAAGETPAPAPHSTPMPLQPSSSEGPRAVSPAEPAGKRGPGLRPAGHAACRKAYAAAVLDTRREGRTSQG